MRRSETMRNNTVTQRDPAVMLAWAERKLKEAHAKLDAHFAARRTMPYSRHREPCLRGVTIRLMDETAKWQGLVNRYRTAVQWSSRP